MPLSVRGYAAHSGSPYTDLGNLFRFDSRPAYADAVLATWCERRGTRPAEALEMARPADLWAPLDRAARRGTKPWRGSSPRALAANTRTGDLHDVP
jgi:hypothetical protein